MSSLKKYKLTAKAVNHQQQLLSELETLAKSVERCEQTLASLKAEMEAINLKHQNRKTTEEDIAFLTDLLRCANRKLGWEKQIASLRKKTPTILQRMADLLQDPNNPPEEEIRAAMLRILQSVQLSLERLEKAKQT